MSSMIPPHLRITQVTVKTEPDRRYRVLVNLTRSDRPRYWVFSCPHCKQDVAEINNSLIASMSDLIDYDAANELVGVRCDGRYAQGRCGIWYYFKLNAK